MIDYGVFYVENNGRFDFIRELPYVVVNVDSNLVARFCIAHVAEEFLGDFLKFYGRIIDTGSGK